MFHLVCQVGHDWQILLSFETCDLISLRCSAAVQLQKLRQAGETLPVFPSIMGGRSITESAFLSKLCWDSVVLPASLSKQSFFLKRAGGNFPPREERAEDPVCGSFLLT